MQTLAQLATFTKLAAALANSAQISVPSVPVRLSIFLANQVPTLIAACAPNALQAVSHAPQQLTVPNALLLDSIWQVEFARHAVQIARSVPQQDV